MEASPDAEPIETMTIVTTTPNELMTPIHNRMPVVLTEDDYDRWLIPGNEVSDLLDSREWPEFEMYPVSTLVNHRRTMCLNVFKR